MTIDVYKLNPSVEPETILSALTEVYDPELGIDVVNLGLVYALQIVGGDVAVTMTLTTPGCPMHGSISDEVERRLERLEGITSVDVNLVWDPPWVPEVMTDVAKRQLGWL
jgi:metal-sulfur cluster biosynthetic enzyme